MRGSSGLVQVREHTGFKKKFEVSRRTYSTLAIWFVTKMSLLRSCYFLREMIFYKDVAPPELLEQEPQRGSIFVAGGATPGAAKTPSIKPQRGDIIIQKGKSTGIHKNDYIVIGSR